MRRKKTIDDLAFPVVRIPKLAQPILPADNPAVTKAIIQQTIKAAYQQKTPLKYRYDKTRTTQLISNEQIELVTSLFEALRPGDAIEAALASQFIAAHIRGMENAGGFSIPLDLLGFSHQALETLMRYRCKYAQVIAVQYNIDKRQQVQNGNLVNVHKAPTENSTISITPEESI